MDQVVEHPPSKCEVSSSNPRTALPPQKKNSTPLNGFLHFVKCKFLVCMCLHFCWEILRGVFLSHRYNTVSFFYYYYYFIGCSTKDFNMLGKYSTS
jgi:hypothetical protein